MQIFDMDGTLIDSNGIWKDVDTAFLAKRGLSYTKEFYEGVAHTISRWRPNSPRNSAAFRSRRRPSWRSGWTWPATCTAPPCR